MSGACYYQADYSKACNVAGSLLLEAVRLGNTTKSSVVLVEASSKNVSAAGNILLDGVSLGNTTRRWMVLLAAAPTS